MSVVPIRAARARLVGLEDGSGHRAMVATVRIIVDQDVPDLVMFGGEPFLRFANLSDGSLIYAQTRPFRADTALTIEVAK